MRPKILKCECRNEYQDSTYGKQNRVCNATIRKPSDKYRAYRCTVCRSEITAKEGK